MDELRPLSGKGLSLVHSGDAGPSFGWCGGRYTAGSLSPPCQRQPEHTLTIGGGCVSKQRCLASEVQFISASGVGWSGRQRAAGERSSKEPPKGAGD